MLNEVVSPPECALALAIPLTEEEFLSDLRDAESKDFARSVHESWGYSSPRKTYSQYQRFLVALVEEVVAEMAALGVTIYRRVPLDAMPAICSKHRVVSLLAHYRYQMLQAEDVLDVAKFRALVGLETGEDGARETPPPRAIDTGLRARSAIRDARSKQDLAHALSAALEEGARFFQQDDASDSDREQAYQSELSRMTLEEAYPDCFVPGRCLEMGDGLCTAWQFIERVPAAFDGLFDFSACHAILLAEALRRQRDRCNSICLSGFATPDVRLTLYRHVIRQLDRCPEPYENAMARAHQALIRQIRLQRAGLSDATAGERRSEEAK